MVNMAPTRMHRNVHPVSVMSFGRCDSPLERLTAPALLRLVFDKLAHYLRRNGGSWKTNIGKQMHEDALELVGLYTVGNPQAQVISKFVGLSEDNQRSDEQQTSFTPCQRRLIPVVAITNLKR